MKAAGLKAGRVHADLCELKKSGDALVLLTFCRQKLHVTRAINVRFHNLNSKCGGENEEKAGVSDGGMYNVLRRRLGGKLPRNRANHTQEHTHARTFWRKTRASDCSR